MSDWQLVILMVCLFFVGSGFWAVWWRLGYIVLYVRDIKDDTTKTLGFSLNPRTRVGQVTSMQSAPVTREQQLSKVGRVASARRVVVGGDEDSGLNQDMNRAVGND